MRTILWTSFFAFVVASAGEAQACGHCRRCVSRDSRAGYSQPASFAQVYYYPQLSMVVTVSPAAAPPAVVQPPQVVPALEPVVQPQYTYQASPDTGVAYYYTYDESGNLIIKQWMDWLFRGGRRAGQPAPPLPIIGRLNN